MARIKPGVPIVKEIKEGESEHRYIHGTGLVLYTRYNNKLYCTKMHDTAIPPIIDKKLEKSINTSIERNSSSLKETITNEAAPRIINVPFSFQTYTNSSSAIVYPSGFIIPGGITDSVLLSAILNGRLSSGTVSNVYTPMSFKCKLKTIRAVAYFQPYANDDSDDARIAFASDIQNANFTRTSPNPTIGATAPTYVGSNHAYASWVISPPGSTWTISKNGHIALTISVTNPSANLFRNIGGNLFFEEVS